MRPIDADVLKQHIDKLPALPDGNFAGNHSALKALINMQPTIEPSTNCSGIPNNSDTINRRDAIEALDCINGVEEVLRSLPSAQPQHQWIPVSERLPEAKQRVLVTFPDGTVDIKICIDAGHLKWFFAHMIAWMPLPEPYKPNNK